MKRKGEIGEGVEGLLGEVLASNDASGRGAEVALAESRGERGNSRANVAADQQLEP